MSLLQYNIKEGELWGDYFYDDIKVYDNSFKDVEDDSEWEIVGQKNNEPKSVPHVARWCREGNACKWKNCKFRHERCAHYDNWIRRGKKGNNCRACVSDPESKKTPDSGGCKYDHRDMANLKTFVEAVPCSNEFELLDNFMPRGLEGVILNRYVVTDMDKEDKRLLLRSLTASRASFDFKDDLIDIDFKEPDL